MAVEVDLAVAGWGDARQGFGVDVIEAAEGVLEVDRIPADDGVGQRRDASGLDVSLVGVGVLITLSLPKWILARTPWIESPLLSWRPMRRRWAGLCR